MEFKAAAAQTFGCRKTDAIGRRLADLIIPAPCREMHRAGLSRYLETGQGAVVGKLIEVSAMHSPRYAINHCLVRNNCVLPHIAHNETAGGT